MTIVQILGALAGAFALLLLVLPAVRVAQGRLTTTQAMGLWISGAGFAMLAMAALVVEGDAVGAAILIGVTATVVGNIVQRRANRHGGGRSA
jgi:hypothetical protein